MKKRWVSLILAVCMAMSFLPVSAFAETAVGDTFSYEYEGQTLNYKVTGDTTVEVTQNTGITGTLKIPDTAYDGSSKAYTVTAIGNEALCKTNATGNDISTLELPTTLKTIGKNAFLGNSSLQNFSFPDGLTSIGNYAFGSIWGITEIEIPASVTRIGGGAFQWCGNVEKIKFGADIQLEELESGVFEHCRKLKNMVVPESVKKINVAAFRDCKTLESVVLSTGVSEIGSAAFAVNNQSFKLHYTGSEEQWQGINIDWDVCQSGGDNNILKQESVVDYNYVPEEDKPSNVPDDAELGGSASPLATAMALTAIGVGTAVVAYQLGTTLYLDAVLPEGAEVPVTYGQLARLMWENAGRPEPEAALAPEADETQTAMVWAVENKLISTGKTADAYVGRVGVIAAWNKAQMLEAAK